MPDFSRLEATGEGRCGYWGGCQFFYLPLCGLVPQGHSSMASHQNHRSLLPPPPTLPQPAVALMALLQTGEKSEEGNGSEGGHPRSYPLCGLEGSCQEGPLEALQDPNGTRCRVIGILSINFHFAPSSTHIAINKTEISALSASNQS